MQGGRPCTQPFKKLESERKVWRKERMEETGLQKTEKPEHRDDGQLRFKELCGKRETGLAGRLSQESSL